MGEVDVALKYHKEALRIRQINLGQNHLKIAHSLDNIAGLYQKQRTYEKSLKAKLETRFEDKNYLPWKRSC